VLVSTKLFQQIIFIFLFYKFLFFFLILIFLLLYFLQFYFQFFTSDSIVFIFIAAGVLSIHALSFAHN